ncbi:hypothetical protein [Embleya sp. NPDC020630]|uniref:VG15 protein n=1 Tax=Embleya sp. NPDC020630 TaxID=3363979 RepID=UPI00378C7EDD
MTSPPEPAEARYREAAAVTTSAMQQARDAYAQMLPARILTDMAGESGRQILGAVIAAQVAMARTAQQYVAACMAGGGVPSVPVATLNPAGFAGIASDGRPLGSLLFIPAITVAQRRAAGASDEEAMAAGLIQMARIVETQIADVDRSSTQVAMGVERQGLHYARVVHLPACARCIILAGQSYSTTEGFERHPGCDCTIMPVTDEQWAQMDGPRALFDSMDKAAQVRAFGIAGRQAILDGANMNAVVNARRGISTATVHGRRLQVTDEGITPRGFAGQRLGNFAVEQGRRYTVSTTPRLMPEEIYRIADDREEALRLLHRYGYILQQPT